jgi:hypothetical protein
MMKNKSLASLFTEVKKILPHSYEDEFKEGKQSVFICICIEQTSASRRTKNRAVELIARRLDGRATYTSWLCAKLRDDEDLINLDLNNNNGKKTQVGRHAWVDSLIAEFS